MSVYSHLSNMVEVWSYLGLHVSQLCWRPSQYRSNLNEDNICYTIPFGKKSDWHQFHFLARNTIQMQQKHGWMSVPPRY